MVGVKNGDSNFAKILKELEAKGADKELLKRLACEHSTVVSSNQELHTELERYQVMFEWVPCTISWIDSSLTYLGVNKALCELYGKGPEHFIDKKVGVHTDQSYFKDFSRDLFTMDEDSHSLELTAEVNGVERHFYLLGTKFQEGEEAVIIGLDVTELVNLQQSVGLMERLSSLGEMVAGIVHEINNPLTVIKVRSQKIPKQLEKENYESVVKSSESITSTCLKIEEIIEGVKSFVRQGHKDPTKEFNLSHSMRQAVLIIESKLKDSFIKVSLPKENELYAMGNQTQLFQVFVNLLTNSIDALNEGAGNAAESISQRWIRMEVENTEDWQRIRFIDSGHGIPKGREEEIFKSFYTSKAAGKGTGLGLSLSRKIIENHGGKLWVDSNHPNTCFVIDLPKRGKDQKAA